MPELYRGADVADNADNEFYEFIKIVHTTKNDMCNIFLFSEKVLSALSALSALAGFGSLQLVDFHRRMLACDISMPPGPGVAMLLKAEFLQGCSQFTDVNVVDNRDQARYRTHILCGHALAHLPHLMQSGCRYPPALPRPSYGESCSKDINFIGFPYIK